MVGSLRIENQVVPAAYDPVVPCISVKEFDPNGYHIGQKFSLNLELGPEAAGVTFPLLLVRGAHEGKTLVVTAGVHGDEFEGVQAILEVIAELDPSVLKGTVIAVPVANPSAFYNGTRTSPLDGLNLARCFPGAERGTPTEVLAFHLGQSIIARADFYLDLHSAGVKLLMPTMVGYDALDPRSRNAAMSFGAPVLWGHPSTDPGRTIAFAASRNIPWLYTEARGAGRVHPDDLGVFKRGIHNLMVHLGILPGQLIPRAVERVLYGNGNVDAAIAANKPGFLVRAVDLLQVVCAHQELGRTLDLHGRVVELFRSPTSGVVGMMRVFPIIESGTPVFLITGSADGSSN
jgi:predicted deacylase